MSRMNVRARDTCQRQGSKEGTVLILHVDNPGSIPRTSYGVESHQE